ncbi:hypothetical protein F4803DRAFT_528227 [Xylaria telfairii]|nr:hypothetical protein F4803DRAFT_528227 [Xylaria telfairii]
MSNELSQFVVVMEEDSGGDAELKFKVQAKPNKNEEQQKALIDAEISGKMVVLADMEIVVHGTMSNGTPATLIVMSFAFLPGRNGKRFKSAEIKMTFTRGHSSRSSPNVEKISPEYSWGVNATKVKVDMNQQLTGNLQAGVGPVTATVGYQGQLTKSYDATKCARVEGARRTLGRDRSSKNSATWKVYENPTTCDGIPTLLKTVILLTRDKTYDDSLGEKFGAKLEIQGDPAWLERMGERMERFKGHFQGLLGRTRNSGDNDEDLDPVIGKAEKGEGIIFNPLLKRGAVEHETELENEDLEKHSCIVMMQTGGNDGDA